MSDEKFTKGPWTWSGASSVLEREGVPLCCLVNSAVNTGDTTEDYANAALISVAPEMYEMLKTACGMFSGTEFSNRAEALLAKARGEE